MRALIVDDEPDILELMSIALELDEDIEGVFVERSAEAAELIRGEPFDLYLFDMMMPPPTGTDLLALVRGRPETASRPVAICTASTSETVREQLFSAGATEVIYKPFKPMTLGNVLRTLARRSGG